LARPAAVIHLSGEGWTCLFQAGVPAAAMVVTLQEERQPTIEIRRYGERILSAPFKAISGGLDRGPAQQRALARTCRSRSVCDYRVRAKA
jgi:hypothetical protein